MKIRTGLLLTAASVAMALPAVAADVTPERLVNAAAEPQNWLTAYGSYNSHNHSALDQINRSNVADLRVAFIQSLGGMDPGSNGNPPNQQGTPLVDDGFLYIANGWSEVLKIDVRAGNGGQIVWTNDPESDRTVTSRNRAVALLGNNVYVTPADARMLSIDRDSGETLWEVSTKAAEAPDNQRHSGPLIAVNDLLIAGQANGSGGNRAWLGGFNAATGEAEWRFWVVPGPGMPGHETWADDHGAWQTGGGAIWTAPSYDPEQNLLIFGTGDPAPWGDPLFRPGDNLYTVSTVAVDADTGELRWYFQETPNESWDYDTVNPKILIDITENGETRQVASNFSRNGFFYTLDRTNGAYLYAQPYLEVNWTTGLDPKTGLPVDYDPNVTLQSYAGLSNRPGQDFVVCPNYYGAPTMFPPTYDAERMIAYQGAVTGCFNNRLTETKDVAVDWRGQTMGANWVRTSAGEQTGAVIGIDVRTGETVKRVETPYSIYSGVMSTGGDLIFTAFVNGEVVALDSDTLETLWSFNTGTPISAPPITYAVDGKQYVAIHVGGQDYSSAFQQPELRILKRNSMLLVFSL